MTVTAADLRVRRIARQMDGEQRTVWLVTWPSTAHNRGRAYYVTTFADSDELAIRTISKSRPVTDRIADKIGPLVRDAITAHRSTPT